MKKKSTPGEKSPPTKYNGSLLILYSSSICAMSKNARMRLAHLAREALQKTADGDWGQSPSARLNDKLIKSRQTGKKLIARHSRITVEFEIAPDGTNLKMINVFVCA